MGGVGGAGGTRGGCGGGGWCGWSIGRRGPQSMQSLPWAQEPNSEPGPPSSQSPSAAVLQPLEHLPSSFPG